MGREITCLRCKEKMKFMGTEKLQLGQTGWILGDLPNLFAGAIEVDIYTCLACKKVEFFLTDNTEDAEEAFPQKQCPECGRMHDFDYPKCPFCKYDYYK